MFCQKCGAKIGEDEQFCGSCGAVIERKTANHYASPPSVTEGITAKAEIINVRKNRMIGIGICVGIIAVIVGITVAVILKIGSDGYEEVAEKYAAALVREDMAEINQYLPYDLKELMGEEVFNEKCEAFEEENNDERMIINTTTINTVEIDSDEKIDDLGENFISQISYAWGRTDNADNIVDTDKIKHAYRVTVRVNVYEKDENEHWPTESFTYTVVKYKGKWKVLTAVTNDLYEMSRVW